MDQEYQELVKDDEDLRTLTLAIFSALPDSDVDIFFDITTKAGTIFKARVLELRDRFKRSQNRGPASIPSPPPSAAAEEKETYIDAGNYKPIAASAFAAAGANIAKFRGVGLMSHAVYFDPTDTEEDNRPTKLHDVLQTPSEKFSDTLTNDFANYLTVYNDLSKVAETTQSMSTSSALGRDQVVQNTFLQGLMLIFGKQMVITKKTGNYQLSQYDCGQGPASEGSTPDAYVFDSSKRVRVIVEVKHSSDSPHVPLRQGISEAINVAIMLLKKRVNWDDVMVFVIGSNGFLLQLGVVFVLYPSFPVFVPLTSCLDMTDDAMRSQACRALCCVQRWIEHKPLLPLSNASSLPVSTASLAALSSTRYHVKELRHFFPAKPNLQTSLHHFFRVMARLHQSEQCRSHVVFPICVREYEESDEESSIVFPKLNDYQIGFPPDAELRRRYFEKLKSAISLIHSVGVVHLDLYPSNIMWKDDGDGDVKLKIIDWDSGHFIDETPSDTVVKNLAARKSVVSTFSKSEDEDNLTVYDWAYYRLMENNIDNASFVSSEKIELDQVFKQLCLNCQLDHMKI